MDWTQLTSITREKVLPKIVDQIGKDQPLFGRLINNIKLWDGGRRLEIVVKYRHNSQGGSYSGLDVLAMGQEQTRTRAYFTVKQLYQPIVLSNIELALNGGAGKIADLMETEMEEAKESLKDKFCTQLFSDGTGNGGKDITGLKAAVGNDGTPTTTYGGITLATYTWFKGNYYAAAGTFSLAMMATAYDACTSGQDSPSIIVTTKTIFTKYEALMEPLFRFVAQEKGYVSGADGGVKSLTFRTIPIIVDEYCPSGEMYFINEKYVQLWYMKHPVHPTDSRGFTVTPMREPINQDGQVGFIFWWGQLTNSQPRRSARILGIT